LIGPEAGKEDGEIMDEFQVFIFATGRIYWENEREEHIA
jgi:hypothetical protein